VGCVEASHLVSQPGSRCVGNLITHHYEQNRPDAVFSMWNAYLWGADESHKQNPAMIAEMDRLLDDYNYADVARILNEKGFKTGDGQVLGGPNAWTDAYLAAFALHANATVATLERKFIPLGEVSIRSLV
jgi:predicted nucleic acid-binding protein